ncbi:MAG: DUF2911 domain-containing protein [Winogradskyella sp.]|nr:MAG: DUF2911 domain-containing protein [Winogradskyella sp.]
MKKIALLAFALTLMFSLNAQVETPQPSPFSKIEQKVGLTDITIEYSRPSVKGRQIFGSLEPYGGNIWRTGANKNTIITFSDDVTVAGQDVKAGSYAIFTRLNSKTDWDVMLYADTENWGAPSEWDDSKVVASAKVEVMEIPFNVETFAIDINSITNNGANLELIWEKSYAAVPFTVPTGDKVQATIDKALAGPAMADYYNAAVFYAAEGKDPQLAKKWMDKALSMVDTPRFWHLRQKSLVYAAAGDKKGAIQAAKESLADAKKSNNAGYVKMNEDSLKEWGAL